MSLFSSIDGGLSITPTSYYTVHGSSRVLAQTRGSYINMADCQIEFSLLYWVHVKVDQQTSRLCFIQALKHIFLAPVSWVIKVLLPWPLPSPTLSQHLSNKSLLRDFLCGPAKQPNTVYILQVSVMNLISKIINKVFEINTELRFWVKTRLRLHLLLI